MAATATTAQRSVGEVLGGADELDSSSFELLYHHYHAALVRFARSRGAHDPEGVSHLALFDAYRAFNRNPIRAERAFRAYLYRAASSHVAGEHRRPTPTPCDPDLGGLVADDPSGGVVDRLWLDGMIDDLTEPQQAVVRDRFLADLSVEQVAERLGREHGAIHQLQHRAVRRLGRAAAVGAVIAVLMAGFWIWRDRAGGDGFVETGPIGDTVDSELDGPAPPPDPSPAVPLPEIVTDAAPNADEVPEDGQVLEIDASPTLPASGSAEVGTVGDDDAEVEGTTSPSGGGPKGDQPLGDPNGDGAAVASEASPDPSGSSGSKPPVGIDAVDSGDPVFKILPSRAIAATTPNRCEYWAGPEDTQTLMLFDPRGDRSAAERFEPPSLVRFVAADGSYQHLDVEGLGQYEGEVESGWTGIESDGPLAPTWADADAEADSGWTLRYVPDLAGGWVEVQYLHLAADGSVMWAVAESCAGEAPGG